MSDTQQESEHVDLDLKEDFSGFSEVSVKNKPPEELPPQHSPQEGEDNPPRIDVSEAIHQAQASAQAESQSKQRGNEMPQLPGVQYMMHPPRPPRPTFWQTLMSRGLTILAVVAIGVLVWWFWSSRKAGTGGVVTETANAVVDAAGDAVNSVRKALKLPPGL